MREERSGSFSTISRFRGRSGAGRCWRRQGAAILPPSRALLLPGPGGGRGGALVVAAAAAAPREDVFLLHRAASGGDEVGGEWRAAAGRAAGMAAFGGCGERLGEPSAF